MANPTSFIKFLREYLEKIKPRYILEWGPGKSTSIMLEESNAHIISIEHQKKWYDHWRKLLSGKYTIILVEAPEENRKDPKWNDYCNPIPSPTVMFDLIFVDGRERNRCLKYATTHLNPNGVVILHDSERPQYREGKELFETIKEESGTCVLKLP